MTDALEFRASSAVPDPRLCEVRAVDGVLRLRLANEIASLGVAQPALHGFLADAGASARTIFHAELVFEELVTNIIRHAYAGRMSARHAIDALIRVGAAEIVLEVEDDGPAFDPVKAPVRPLPAHMDEARIGGLGLRFIHAVTTRLHYARAGERNRVTASIDRG